MSMEEPHWRDPTALRSMLSDDRRRQEEAVHALMIPEETRMLLPLALALARLAARRDAANGAHAS